MKKIIALLLALVMCLGLFAGCVEETPNNTTAAAPTVEEANDYLYAMYKESAELVLRDFERVAAVMIDGVKFPVTWTVDVTEDLVKITVNETMATIDINEKPAEDFTFTLTATVTGADGKTATTTFKHSVKAPATTGTLFVEKPEVGVAYKFALQQNAIDGQPVLYFTGKKSGNYLATSTNPLDAVDVVIEATEGGYYLTFMDGETKKYINITTYEKDDGSLSKTQDIGTEPTCVYTWDAERLTMVAYIEALKDSFYLGTYNTYNTISASATSYIKDVSVIGVKQFPAGFVTINAAVVEKPETGKAYVWGLKQNGIDGQPTLYFTGEKSGNYLATSTNIGDAVRVYLEEAEGGYHMFFLVDGAKKYINITTYEKDDGSLGKSQDIGDEPTCVYTWDAERGTMIAFIEALNESFYLGTYNTYNTISTSATSYIKDVSVIGVKQFPAIFFDLGLPVEEPKEEGGETAKDPAADSELSIKDAIALGASKEHNVYTEGKYYVTGTITEISNETYGNMKIADKDGNVLTIYGTFDADGTNRFDKMETKPAVGDTVTIYGIIGQYNGTPQLKNGWIQAEGETAAQLPPVTAPVAGTAYKFGMIQVNNGHTVYLAGGVDQDRFLTTTTDKAAALDVFVEASGDGFKFKVTIDGADMYITLGKNEAGKDALSYSAEGTVWKYDATISAWCAELGGTMYYMGSYNTFDTISASKTSYIKEDNKGVTQFPAGFFEK